MKMLRILSLASMAAASAAISAQAETLIYDNLANPLGNYLGGFSYEEVADDVDLDNVGTFTRATVAYAGFNFDGDETLTLTLYKMDGAPTPGSFGFDTPGTAIYSQTIPITATAGMEVDFVDATPDVVLPDFLGIGLSFGGVDFDPTGGGSDAGPLLFHPPSLGSSLDDYWLRGFPNAGDPWGLYTFGGNPPINIGVRIYADGVVPEPGTWVAMIGFGAIAGSMAFRRIRGSR